MVTSGAQIHETAPKDGAAAKQNIGWKIFKFNFPTLSSKRAVEHYFMLLLLLSMPRLRTQVNDLDSIECRQYNTLNPNPPSINCIFTTK